MGEWRYVMVKCKACKYYYAYSSKWGVCEYTREHQGKALDVNPEHFCGWAEKQLTAEDGKEEVEHNGQ